MLLIQVWVIRLVIYVHKIRRAVLFGMRRILMKYKIARSHPEVGVFTNQFRLNSPNSLPESIRII